MKVNKMDKEILDLGKIKSGLENFDKFMRCIQSEEKISVRKTIVNVEQTMLLIACLI